MAISTLIRFLNIVLVALLAGTSFGIWAGFNPQYYSYATYVEQQQHLVRSLHTLMVSMVIVSTLLTLTSAFLQRQNKPAFYALMLAGTLLASCIIISRFGNLPLQTEMLRWSVNFTPDNWTVLRDQWWSFHLLRVAVELVALVIVVWEGIRK